MKTGNPVLVILAAGCVASGCSRVQGNEPKAPRPVRVHQVAEAPAAGRIRYSATIEALQQMSLAFKVSGYVDHVAQRTGPDGKARVAQAGDRVTKGMLLARVNEADYRERVSSGQAKLAEGEATWTKARLDLERARTLFDADSLTKPELDAAQASHDTAHARIAAAKAEIELAQSALRDCALVAPATGVLLERRIEVGTLVGTGSVGFVLADVSQVKARFGIPDSMIQSVKTGDHIGVAVDAVMGASFSGLVTAVAPAADPQSRVFDVEVTIPNADGRLRPGMIGSVALGPSAPSGPQPLIVPLSAVTKPGEQGDHFAVFMVEGQGGGTVARLQRVELGEVMGNGVAVLKGLSAGDRVIVTGGSLLVNGEPIHVIP